MSYFSMLWQKSSTSVWRLRWAGDRLTERRPNSRPSSTHWRTDHMGFFENCVAKGGCHAVAFDDIHEQARWQLAPFGMVPAHQRLDSGNALVQRADLRLEMQLELVKLEGVAHIRPRWRLRYPDALSFPRRRTDSHRAPFPWSCRGLDPHTSSRQKGLLHSSG